MYPIGTYERFISDLKNRGRVKERANVFGILLADIRQDDTKQYILNYIDTFNNSSGEYIDFYVPGYYKEETSTKENKNYHNFNEIVIGSQKFQFSSREYEKFIQKFMNDFKLDRQYVPVLYLLEWKCGNFNKSEIIEFELDNGSD